MKEDGNVNDLIEPLLDPPIEDEEQRDEVEHAATDMNIGSTNTASSSGEQGMYSNTTALDEQTWERGEMQPSKFRDAPFAIIFLAQFIAMAIHGSISLSSFLSKNTIDSLFPHQGSFDLFDRTAILTAAVSVLSFVIYTALISKLFSSQSRIAKLIAFGLWMTVVSAIVTSMTLLYKGMILSGLLAAFYGAWGTYYYFSIKDRIPFAAANLNCGMSAVRQNTGVVGVGAILCLLTNVWMVLWAISLINMTDPKQDCSNASNSYCSIHISRPGFIFPWALSLFWTIQVLQYSIHTMAAGVTAAWYFAPQDAFGFCSLAVRGSVQRSLTTSFGSICLGALLIAVIEFLAMIVKMLRSHQRERNSRRGGFEELLLCCLDCILRLVEDVMQYFNKWVSLLFVLCIRRRNSFSLLHSNVLPIHSFGSHQFKFPSSFLSFRRLYL